jgi:hypothetical protein
MLARGWLALALLAACWASARGSEESWSSRLWPGNWFAKKTPEGQKDGKGQPVKDKEIKADPDAGRRLRAELDWKRRSEVCQKLRQIAYETNDDELDRFAERLDQRAWDVYLKQTGGGPGLSLDEHVIGERLGIDFNNLSPAPRSSPGVDGFVPGSVKAREER